MPALDGMRILDMTQYEAGTSCTQALAWLGADVVKLESPTVGDPGRGVATGTEYSPYFCNWNANKRSLTLNLRKPEGRELLLRLLPRFDVFVENYGPGVVERLGLTYDEVDPLLALLVDARISRATAIARGFSEELVDRVTRLIVRSQFKRRPPVIAKVSARSVGWEFRYPRDWLT